MNQIVDKIFYTKLKVINMGIEQFGLQLKSEGQDVLLMAWKPPAGGDMELLEILDRLRKVDDKND
jgi:hypothetical protein